MTRSAIRNGSFVWGLAVVLGACSQADGATSESDAGLTLASPIAPTAPTLADTTLARLVTEIQPTVEQSARIEATGPLHVAATDEARLRAYLEEQVSTQLSTEEAAAITRTYARLGMVPETIDLQALFLALLEEQVVGYYDPVTDTLFVHERVSVEQLEPVLAHELVHALQDQYVPLDSVAASLSESNDAAMAYQAAVEGHATYAMFEWQSGKMLGQPADLTTFPDLGPMMANLDLSAFGDLGPVDVLIGAPTVIREGLMFPYVGGLVFLQRLWTRVPERPLPFGAEMPRSTEQILHVDRWIDGDEPTPVSFTGEPSDWSLVYSKDMGELETRIFFEDHLGDRARAEAAAMGWDGDAIRLYETPGGDVLLWVSVWDAPAEADEFAAAVLEAYDVRYGGSDRAVRVERGTKAGRALVRVVDAPAGVEVPESAVDVEVGADGGP